METEGEIAVGLRSDGVVYELHREASILRRGPRSAARANAVRPARLPRSIAEIPRMPLGYRQIIIESLQILKTIERSGEQRVGAAAWPFLLSLRAVRPMAPVPTMFHGRYRSARCCDSSRHPGGSIRFQFQPMFATRFQIKLHLNSGPRFGRAARVPRFTEF
jgi:hypothetical protein